MAFTIFSDERAKWMYAPEAVFGTAIAMSATSFKQVLFSKATFPSLGMGLSNIDSNRASRVFYLGDYFVDSYSGPVEIAFTMPMSIDRVSDFLYAVLQNRISQGGASAYQKVFEPHATQPDFTANAGYFFTLLWVPTDGATSRAVRFTSCIIKTLTLEFGKGAGDANIARMSGTILAKKVEIEQNYTGTSAAQGTTWIKAFEFTPDLTLPATGGDVQFAPNFRNFTLTIDNGGVPIDKGTTGHPVTYFLNPAMGMKASLSMWLDTYSYEATYSRRNGSLVTFSFSRGSNGVTGYHNIVLYGVITNDPLTSGENQMYCNIDLQLGDLTAGGADALTYTIADGISQ